MNWVLEHYKDESPRLISFLLRMKISAVIIKVCYFEITVYKFKSLVLYDDSLSAIVKYFVAYSNITDTRNMTQFSLQAVVCVTFQCFCCNCSNLLD